MTKATKNRAVSGATLLMMLWLLIGSALTAPLSVRARVVAARHVCLCRMCKGGKMKCCCLPSSAPSATKTAPQTALSVSCCDAADEEGGLTLTALPKVLLLPSLSAPQPAVDQTAPRLRATDGVSAPSRTLAPPFLPPRFLS